MKFNLEKWEVLWVIFFGFFFFYLLILEIFVCKEFVCICYCSGYYFMKSRNNNWFGIVF